MIALASPPSDSSDTIFSRDQFLAKHIIKTSIIMFVLLSALRWAFLCFLRNSGNTYYTKYISILDFFAHPEIQVNIEKPC